MILQWRFYTLLWEPGDQRTMTLFLHSESYAVYFPTWTMRKMSTCMFDTASPRATYTEFVNTTMVNQFLAILKRDKASKDKIRGSKRMQVFLIDEWDSR